MMRGIWTIALLILLAVPVVAKPALKKDFVKAYPAVKGTQLDKCTACHTTGSKLNPYGADLKKVGNNFAKAEGLDSDKDGVANIVEIKALSNPGNREDKPGHVH